MANSGPGRGPRDVLDEWRSAERALEQLTAGTSEWRRVQLQAAALAEEYQRRIADREQIARELGSPVGQGDADEVRTRTGIG
jgi:hypothetical protein